jgi:predicted SnoaL-like aldol condensation-catalyzing enzyme
VCRIAWPGNADNPGRALADFFRLQDGKVVEHWDVIQDVPNHANNPQRHVLTSPGHICPSN